ncbi:MAG: DUF2946 family protein [Pseudomonadota bacterium]
MRHLRPFLRHCTWLVLLAAVLWSLAPSVARVVQGQDNPSFWLAVCSASTRGVAASAKSVTVSQPAPAAPAAPADDNAHSQHCPLCASSGGEGSALPLMATWSLPLQVRQEIGFPRLFMQAHRVLFAWAAPPSRGPPSFIA